jgi:hypothetical protein
METKITAVVLVISLLEGIHVTLVREIAKAKPALLEQLGRVGPGYYFFGLFWFAPAYRSRLTSGQLKAELAEYPALRRLAGAELFLWYAMWAVIAAAVII